MFLDTIWICALALQLVLLFQIAQPQSIVKTLPGYDGPLPVKLETGYIGVGEREEIQFFYYFMESERNPEIDPLLIWFCGGPGCSVLGSLFHQIEFHSWYWETPKNDYSEIYKTWNLIAGPVEIDIKASNSTSIRLRRRQYSWTQISNMLLFDTPVGTGFSYSTTSEGYSSSDTKSIKNYHQFIQKWLLAHPQFLNNPLFIGGDSYAGKIVPPLVYEIVKGNESGQNPKISLQGYLVGNPLTHLDDQEVHWHYTYANRMGLISDKYIEQAKKSCGPQFVNQDPNNTACSAALNQIQLCLSNANYVHILEPTCVLPPYLLNFNPSDYRDPETELLCRDRLSSFSPAWANLPIVQKALHVRTWKILQFSHGTIDEWSRCNHSIDNGYGRDIELLTNKTIQALVYSGDHDLIVPWLLTFDWVQRLNMTISDDWRPWIVDGQNSGYTVRYKYNNIFLTFATVKGGGHLPQEQRPKECLAMVDKWFDFYLL